MKKNQRKELQEKDDVRDKVFMESFIPRSLHQVDFDELADQQEATDVSVAVAAVSKMTVQKVNEEEAASDSNSEQTEEEDGEAEFEKKEAFTRSGTSKEERKAHKAAVKAERAEQRKHKIKKKDKKLHRVPVAKPPKPVPLDDKTAEEN